jgi:Zn-dependent protease with chaperone function
VVGPVVLALATAELGARLLSPRDAPVQPADVDVRAYFSEQEIERGRRFVRPQMALGLARSVVDLAALAAVVRTGPPPVLRRFSRPAAAGAAFGAGLAVALTLPPLPLAAIARQRAIGVGLVTQSWRGWAFDLVKSTAIGAALAAGAGAAAVGLTRRYPRAWWLPAAGASIVFGSLFATLAPVLLDPIFNNFVPLPEGEIRSDVLELARAAGVKVGEVYSVDASRRTTAANAYVTGLGPTKRVVLYDTLLDRYDRDEVRIVVAHELAHVRNRDVPRSIAYAAIVAPGTALAVQRVSWALSPERGNAAYLPALGLATALVGAPLGLIGNRLSRAVERRADDYSLQLSRAPKAFVSFERAIALQNVADLEPPAFVHKLLATHPPTAERIGAAVAWEQRHSDGGGATSMGRDGSSATRTGPRTPGDPGTPAGS